MAKTLHLELDTTEKTGRSLLSLSQLLSKENIELLRLIYENKPKTLQDISRLSGRSPSNLTRTLSRLAEYGVLVKGGKKSVPFEVKFDSIRIDISLGIRFKDMSKLRVVSLFSGCGGLDLGFKNAGFDIIFANDIEPSVKETYQKNLGHEILIKDIRTVDKKTGIPDEVDVVLAGIPCQPFSNAGKRGAMKDDRGTLFEQVMEVVDIKKPKAVLFENVRGFLSAKDDRGQLMPERIREELDKHGYTMYYKLLNAADYEVPQNRYRVVMIGIRNDIAKHSTFSFPEPLPRSEKQTVGAVIKDSKLKDEEFEVWPLSPQASFLSSHIPAGGSWKSIPYELLPERLKKIRDNMARYHSPNFYRKFNDDEIMGTVTAAATPENSGILHPHEIRRYSVREAARFQSFPDTFKFLGDSVAKKYKMIGNAVPPLFAFHIAKRIKEFLKEE